MKIEEWEISGWVRSAPSNIRTIRYTPDSLWQLILGSNGSGKSSMLYELSLLPPTPADFVDRTGYKKVKARHNGVLYEAISVFNRDAGKHTFIKDGVVLNDNGTATVQKQLIEQETGLTTDIQRIVSGRLLFTDMPAQQRRELIMRLSSADYTYALGVFKALAKAERDLVGANRIERQKLAHATSELKALPELEGLDIRAENLRQELNLLLTARVPNVAPYEQVRQRLYTTLREVEVLAREVLTLRPTHVFQERSWDGLRNSLSAYDEDIAGLQGHLNVISRDYSDLESIVSSITQAGEIIPENIEGAILELEAEIVSEKAQLERFTDLTDADALRQDNDQVLEQVILLWHELPDNTDRKYSRERMDQARVEKQRLEQEIDTARARLSQIDARLSIMNATKDTTCPDCGFVWKDGYSQQEAEGHHRNQHAYEESIQTARAAIKDLDAYLELSEEYSALYSRFRGFVSSYPRLRPLWSYLVESKALTDQPHSAIGVFHLWQRDVEITARVEEKQRRVRHLTDLAARQDGESGHFNQRLIKLHAEIEKVTDDLQKQRAEAKLCRAMHEQLTKLENRSQALQQRVQEIQTLQATALDALRNQEIDQVVRVDQNELAVIQRQLTDKHALDGVIHHLTTSLEEQELEQKALSILAEALSPTEGVIAEQLTGFIECLVAQMNLVIDAVWNTPLTVLPCGMESGELDYKFPFTAGDAGLKVLDVSMGSTAQKEIFNFSAMLMVMLYLNMQDWPLFTDELGSGFDEAHRVKVMRFVRELMDSGRFSQIFMISHYISNHGALTNAQTLVLHGGNVAVPGEHNTHAELS